MEGLGNHRQLCKLRHRLDARDDGNSDTHRTGFLYKLEILLIIVEQLGHGILCTQFLFLFQILHVHFQVGRFLVLLRIAGHTVIELSARTLDRCAVSEESLVELFHLSDKFRRVRMSARGGYEATILLGLVATQQQQVADTEKL